MRLRAGQSLRPRRLLSQAGWAFLCFFVLLPSGARIAGQTKPAAAPAANPLLPILTDELRRNVEGLKREATPPYFASYTVYDVQSAYRAGLVRRAHRQVPAAEPERRRRRPRRRLRARQHPRDPRRHDGRVPRLQPDRAAAAGPAGRAGRRRPGRPLAGDRSQVQAGHRALHQGQDERRGQGAGRRRRRRSLPRAAGRPSASRHGRRQPTSHPGKGGCAGFPRPSASSRSCSRRTRPSRWRPRGGTS